MPSLCVYVEADGKRCCEKAYYGIRGEKKTHCTKHKSVNMTSSQHGHLSKEEGILQRRLTRLSNTTINDYQQQLIDMRSTIVLVGIISPFLTENAGINSKIEAFDTKCVHVHGTFCDTTLYNFLEGSSCPECSYTKRGNATHARSLLKSCCADDENMCKVWVSSNPPLTDVPLQSNVSINYNCMTCGHHVTDMVVGNLYKAFKKGNFGCRFCNKPSKFLCEDLECAVCRPNRMSSIERVVKCLVRIIGYTGTLQTLRTGSDVNLENKCDVCNHLFVATCSELSQGTWCPYCASKRLCGCEPCRMKTLGSLSHVVENWSDRNTRQPHEVFLGATEKVWLVCPATCKQHYQIIPYLINREGRNNCPYCLNKTVAMVSSFLRDKGYDVILEFTFEKRKRTSKPYDIVVKDDTGRILLFIEVDGPHHFGSVSYNGSSSKTNYDQTFQSDIEKMKVVLEKGYIMLRLIQEDVWYGDVEYMSFIIDAIERSQNEAPCIRFQKSDKYDAHNKALYG